MPCEVIKLDDRVVFLCGRGPAPKTTCRWCDRPARYLCDFRVQPGVSCDAPMCGRHRRHVVEGIDYCESHRHATAGRPVFGQTPPAR